MAKLILKRFKVTNFRNIDDSDWIPVEHVTAFVGRNESGKTTLLKALHKFNPGTPEPYNPQREFPRDRFTQDYRNGSDWPVCAAEFELTPEFRSELKNRLGSEIPNKAIFTRFYDNKLETKFETTVSDSPVPPADLSMALDTFASGARRLSGAQEREAELQEIRADLANWATAKKDKLVSIQDLRTPAGIELVKEIRTESNSKSKPDTANLVEALQSAADGLLGRAQIRIMT